MSRSLAWLFQDLGGGWLLSVHGPCDPSRVLPVRFLISPLRPSAIQSVEGMCAGFDGGKED